MVYDCILCYMYTYIRIHIYIYMYYTIHLISTNPWVIFFVYRGQPPPRLDIRMRGLLSSWWRSGRNPSLEAKYQQQKNLKSGRSQR